MRKNNKLTREEKREQRTKQIIRRVFAIGLAFGIVANIAIPKVCAYVHDYYVANHHYGQNEPYANNYVDAEGKHYHWVWYCTPYCNGEHDDK